MCSGSIAAITWALRTPRASPPGRTSWCSKRNRSGGRPACQWGGVPSRRSSDQLMRIGTRNTYAAVGCLLFAARSLQAQPVNEGKATAPEFSPALAEKAFDQLWQAFDKNYAMFVLRPEVDWNKIRDEFRPKALASQSPEEFANRCADTLKPLRDLHLWLTLDGRSVPVFNRPRASNSNPAAHRVIVGDLKQEGRVTWAITADNIGFLAISGWNNDRIPSQFDQ